MDATPQKKEKRPLTVVGKGFLAMKDRMLKVLKGTRNLIYDFDYHNHVNRNAAQEMAKIN